MISVPLLSAHQNDFQYHVHRHTKRPPSFHPSPHPSLPIINAPPSIHPSITPPPIKKNIRENHSEKHPENKPVPKTPTFSPHPNPTDMHAAYSAQFLRSQSFGLHHIIGTAHRTFNPRRQFCTADSFHELQRSKSQSLDRAWSLEHGV